MSDDAQLQDYLTQLQAEVRGSENDHPYSESAFTQIVMEHLAGKGMTHGDPVTCHYSGKIGNANLRMSGYSISEEGDKVDLFVSLYAGSDEVQTIADTETLAAAEQCLRFVGQCADGRMTAKLDSSTEAYALALTLQGCYANLEQIRIYVLTDRKGKTKSFKPREQKGKVITIEVMDLERLYRHLHEGKDREEIVVDLATLCGTSLPCVYVPGSDLPYDYALTVIPARALEYLYERYGSRLLEANVRSFLSASGKVNKGIKKTLEEQPEMFMAYNNGLVLLVDEMRTVGLPGGHGISWMKGLQIVNGGQTTASIYFGKRSEKKDRPIDLDRVRVPAKIIIPRDIEAERREELISDISLFSNSQNSVKAAALQANHPFHVEMEKLSTQVYCPDGVGRWYYERAAGSYNVMLAKEGTTPAKKRLLKESMPPHRKFLPTDLAKYLQAWSLIPHVVCRGAQKNFVDFMQTVDDPDSAIRLPDTRIYKRFVALGLIFRAAIASARLVTREYPSVIAAYVVSVLSMKCGDTVDLDMIWMKQAVSVELQRQLHAWSGEVNTYLNDKSIREGKDGGAPMQTYAKEVRCWLILRGLSYSEVAGAIPEFRLRAAVPDSGSR